MSTLINKWKEQGWEEGRQEGRVEDRQDSIIRVLPTRFETVPDATCTAIQAISAPRRLEELLSAAVTCASIDQFAESLK